MKYAYYILIVCVLLISCKKTNSTDIENEIKINQTTNEYKINDIFYDFELLPLNTTKDGVFKNIDKIVFHKGFYYIMDKTGKRQILVFDENGEYKKSIGQFGKGRGEYINIEDFTIDEENNRIVILTYPSTVYIYNMDGDFIFSKKIEDNSLLWNIINYPKGFVCSTNHQTYTEGEHAYLLYFFDKDFNYQAKHISVLPQQMVIPTLTSNPLMKKENGSLVYFDIYTNCIHNIGISDSIRIQTDKFILDYPMPYQLFANTEEFASKQMGYDFFLKTICIDNNLLAFYITNKEIKGFILEDRDNTVNAFKYVDWLPDLKYYKDGIIYSTINMKNIEQYKELFKSEIPDSSYNQANEFVFKFKYNRNYK